jgi:hypothetical protein
MITNSFGPSAKLLKRQAKKLSKELGIKHAAALDQVAAKAGYVSWKDFHKRSNQPLLVRPLVVRPLPPEVPVLKCYDISTGRIIGERPNALMPVSQHKALGSYLKEILNMTIHYRRAYKPLNDILLKMDDWLGYEYSEEVLPIESFNEIYMNRSLTDEPAVPSIRQQERLKRKLRKARAIIKLCYHDCRPIRKLEELFDLAFEALNKWPVNIVSPIIMEKSRRLSPGTFVTKRGSKKLIMVFSHSLQSKIVEGYSDAGYFCAGRHEVTLVKEPVEVAEFKPLRLFLPYGKWSCADGLEVLFNRDYCPIWVRHAQGVVSAVSPSASFNYKDSEFYFDDRSAPYYCGNKKHFRACVSVLEEWGVAEIFPEIFNLIPEAIATGDVRILSPKGFS